MKRGTALNRPQSLPLFILIRRIGYALTIQPFDHSVKRRLPHIPEPLCMTEPFYKRRTNGVIGMNERTAIPCFRKRIITIAAQRPHLRAIIRAVYGGSDIAAAFLSAPTFRLSERKCPNSVTGFFAFLSLRLPPVFDANVLHPCSFLSYKTIFNAYHQKAFQFRY